MTDNDRAVITAPEKAPTPLVTRSSWALPVCFGFAGFLAAFLLFTIEPLAAKSLLPTLGGSAAVWNTAMAFFQIVLLLGYLAAHIINTWIRGRARVWVQLAVLVAPTFLLPFVFPSGAPSDSPVAWELSALSLAVGAPFFALANFSPSLQRWFSWTEHPRAHDPFFLYAASNVGSFVGLLAYPLVIEPNLGLITQSNTFRWLYIVLIVFAAALLIRVRPVDQSPVQRDIPIPWQRRLRWIGWAAVPSFALLAVTRHIATDVASFPLLWVIPLALYLATFVLAFSKQSEMLGRIAARAFPLLAVIALTAASGVLPNLFVGISLPLVVLLASGLMAHGRLYADRPSVSDLTEFYLWTSVGGAVGGMLAAFVAPVAFNSIAEYPLALVATALLLTGQFESRRRARLVLLTLFAVLLLAAVAFSDVNAAALAIGGAGAVAFLLAGRSAWFAPLLGLALLVAHGQSDGRVLARARTFYGVYRVVASDEGNHVLVSGTTIHGAQRFSPVPSTKPMVYYVPEGPTGQLMDRFGDGTEIGVIGLGVGSVASYVQSEQRLTFFEIDPAVLDLAMNRNLFTFLAESEGGLEFVLGDGRLMLTEVDRQFQLLIVDAFSSDAIPVHLLTLEAMRAYRESTSSSGVVAFHISNRHLDLEPVIGRLADELDLSAVASSYVPSDSDGAPTQYVVVARDQSQLSELGDAWKPARIGTDLWTDEFSNLIGILR
ncbi:MAG TPA: hypothetical protein VJ796_03450 [Acidimicrobiia bacterium]|nr:hypothetical protein [Acidimicrobiia bacterium]